MKATPVELREQAARSIAEWPFTFDLEDAHGLPPFLLVAVASRETNCTNEPGDAAPRRTDPPMWPGKPYHAWSPWQIDRNSGGSPDLLNDPRRAADIAAGMLADHYRRFGDWRIACSAYNAGEVGAEDGLRHGDSDHYTTGGDYGADVMERRAWLVANVAPPPSTVNNEEDDVDPRKYPGAFVRLKYREILLRNVDPAGYGTFVPFLQQGGDPEKVIQALTDSAEGQNAIARVRATVGL